MKQLDPEAQFARGMKMALAPASAGDWFEAVSLISAAADAGHGEAAERAALFEWMRARTPPERAKALDRLRQAADLGSDSARGQLLVLAKSDDGSPGDAPGHIESLIKAPVGQTAIERPFVGVIPHFASAAECRWLVDRARDWLDVSTVYDPSTGGMRPDPLRTNKSAMIDLVRADVVTEVVRTRIAAALRAPIEHFEASQVLRYLPGEEFKPHHDYFDQTTEGFRAELAQHGQRVATLLIYLNDEFEGGETRFPSLGFNYRGRTGDAIAFFSVDSDGTPNPLTLHAGLPPTSGEKWIFSQWIRDRAGGSGPA